MEIGGHLPQKEVMKANIEIVEHPPKHMVEGTSDPLHQEQFEVGRYQVGTFVRRKYKPHIA